MEKEALRSILSTGYQPAFWRNVLTDIFGARELLQKPKPITLPANELAEAAFELGSLTTTDNRLVGLYQVDLLEGVRIGQNRVGVRSLLRNIYRHDVDAALVVFVQGDKWRLSLISEIRVLDDNGDLVEQKTEPKRFTYLLGRGETVRTAVDRLDLLQGIHFALSGLIEAFSVEKLNKDFFREYKVVFDTMEAEVEGTIEDVETARLYTQRLFNRLMFLYFIQKKGWMRFEKSENYLRSIFNRADANGENFLHDRLYWVFFYGLSNQAESIEIQTNDFLVERRGDVPYLNGGLFEMEKDGLDDKDAVSITNDRFADILKLFESYNFTIDESTPFEVQVAVDPEMLGKVFEELVTGRHESGSYYTPRPVVSFMCREALKHALSKCDGAETIAKLVDDGDGKDVRDPETILERLRQIRVCDPACGSGAYLLGMLQELLHVREALFAAEKIEPDAQYKWKREIIENSIYGVDMDRFATQIASLRLWLSLAIESDEPKPLPNLKYKIGCGDSLLAPIETVGQGNLQRRALIEQFRTRKQEYTDAGDHLAKVAIDNEIERLRVEIARTLHHLPKPPRPAEIILAEKDVQPLREKVDRLVKGNEKGQAEKFQKQLDQLLARIAKLKAAGDVGHYDTGEIFDWSVEFAEVFEDGGFDVVLANPPYVRQEEIDKTLKKKLLASYPGVMTGKSDLYVAFYVRGLQLLRSDGVHVFVCSNSWLDVGYGGKLQGHILDHAHIAAVYDSALERQFATAAINTIISFIHKEVVDDSQITRFVSLRAPFAEAVSDDTKCRVISKTRRDLLNDGSNENGKYEGGKWGGKYLRAPDIYFTILRKGEGKLERLGRIAHVRRGVTTGANEFFILDNAERQAWQIEEEFLSPIVKSPRECVAIVVKAEHISFSLFSCQKDRRELRGTNALKYIEWGETDSEWIDEDGIANPPYLRPTCRARANWYDIGVRQKPSLNINYLVNEVMRTFIKEDGFFVSDNFQEIHTSLDKVFQIGAAANSTLFQLFANVSGRANFGEGLMKVQTYEVQSLPIVDPVLLPADLCEAALENAGMLDLDSDERRELDAIVFDALGLTTGERDAVYESVIDLVSKRLQRAQTITN